MATVAHLDTHVVVWLYAGELARVPDAARVVLETADLAISPMVSLELAYLVEIGRLTVSAPAVLDDLGARIGLRTDDAPFPAVVAAAADLAWTRDPFDRLIAAQASLRADTLITADRTIQEHVPGTTWD